MNLNGLYTECDDQSAWYYLRSLVYLIVDYAKRKTSTERDDASQGKETLTLLPPQVAQSLITKEINDINELEEAAPDCMYLSSFRSEMEHLLHSIRYPLS